MGDKKRKLHQIHKNDIHTPSFMAGLLDFKSIQLMQYLLPDFPKDAPIKKKMCHLCGDRRATHYIWEANVGRLIGKDSCHVFMCGRCVSQALYIQNTRYPCSGCQKWWPPPCFSIKLPTGEDSSLLCKDCHIGGGHREELVEAIKHPNPRIKLTKSM